MVISPTHLQETEMGTRFDMLFGTIGILIVAAVGVFAGYEYGSHKYDLEVRRELIREEDAEMRDDAIGISKGAFSNEEVRALELIAKKRPVMMNWHFTACGGRQFVLRPNSLVDHVTEISCERPGGTGHANGR